MKYIEGNIRSLLAVSFSEIHGSVRSVPTEFGTSSGTPSARLNRQLSQAVASKVVGYVDRKLPKHAADFFNFIFGESTWSNYCGCQKHLMVMIESGDTALREDVAVNIGRLSTLVPYQVRAEIHQQKCEMHSQQSLGELLGTDRFGFSRKYKNHWSKMINCLLEIEDVYAPEVLSYAENSMDLGSDYDGFEKSA